MLIDPWVLNSLIIGVFFVSALLHSSVGLGGGSSYTAWMVILAVPSLMIGELGRARYALEVEAEDLDTQVLALRAVYVLLP